MDIMMELHDALIADDYIKQKTGFVENGIQKYRIKFFGYPATASVTQPYIIIDSLSPPIDTDFADDEPIIEEYLYQVDVWTNNRITTKELARRVKEVLREKSFYYFAGGVDEYDPATKIYRDARRFRTKVYSEDIEALI